MITYAPHFLALAGCTLLLTAAINSTQNLISTVLLRLVPAAVGAPTVWMSAIMFAGGA